MLAHSAVLALQSGARHVQGDTAEPAYERALAVPVPVALRVRLPAVTQAPKRLGDFEFQQLLQVASNPEPEGFLQRVERFAQLRQSGCSGGSVAHGVVSSALAGAVSWFAQAGDYASSEFPPPSLHHLLEDNLLLRIIKERHQRIVSVTLPNLMLCIGNRHYKHNGVQSVPYFDSLRKRFQNGRN